MSAIIIEKVKDKKGLDAFIQFHYDLYKGNEYSVPNLYSDEVRTLSKDKNAAFEFCEAEYFLAYKDGKVVGRVAGIINKKANEKWGLGYKQYVFPLASKVMTENDSIRIKVYHIMATDSITGISDIGIRVDLE